MKFTFTSLGVLPFEKDALALLHLRSPVISYPSLSFCTWHSYHIYLFSSMLSSFALEEGSGAGYGYSLNIWFTQLSWSVQAITPCFPKLEFSALPQNSTEAKESLWKHGGAGKGIVVRIDSKEYRNTFPAIAGCSLQLGPFVVPFCHVI